MTGRQRYGMAGTGPMSEAGPGRAALRSAGSPPGSAGASATVSVVPGLALVLSRRRVRLTDHRPQGRKTLADRIRTGRE
jgi:hypothetical protein